MAPAGQGMTRAANGMAPRTYGTNPEASAASNPSPPVPTCRNRAAPRSAARRNAKEDGRQHQGGGVAESDRRDRDARAETCRLAELEQQQLAAAARRPDRKAARVGCPVVAKVTEAELLRRLEVERLRLEREAEAEAAKKWQARTADEEEYERVVLVANTNKDDSIIEARSVEDAIAKMSIAAEPALPPDRHPERRLKVSYKEWH